MRRAAAGQMDDRLSLPEGLRAGLGMRVTIRRGILMSDVWIVGEDEADPSRGRIASTAPLARALEGAVRGDVVEVEGGGRIDEISVLAVRPGEGC